MNANMSGELMLLSELASAISTLEWFFASVGSFMIGTLLIGHELFPTIRAWVTAIVEMGSFMSVTDVSAGKSLATNRTQKGTHFAVSMSFPRVLSSKRHATFFALVGSYSRMDALKNVGGNFAMLYVCHRCM